MTKSKHIPKRRFPGFEGKWEEVFLGKLGNAQSGIGFPDSEQGGKVGIPFYKVSDMNNQGNEHEMVFANNYVTIEQIKQRSWKPIQDVPAILFAKVGAAVLLNRKRLCSIPFLMDNNTMAFSIDTSKFDTNFAKTIFETIDLTSLVQVGALPSYNARDVESILVSVPSILEQEKIGEFFQKIDSLITIHQHKLDKLKNLKKSYLAELFPAEGERVPKRRFPGFEGEWSTKELREITSLITKGTTPLDKSGEGEVNFIKVENLDASNGKILSCTKISSEEHNGYLKRSQLNENDILFSIAGTLGRIGIVESRILPANTNQALAIIRNKRSNLRYLAIALKSGSVTNFILRNPTIGAQPNLSLEQVGSLEIPFPSLDEQKQIGEFFHKLDQSITLQQHKLDKLNDLKNAYLNELFV